MAQTHHRKKHKEQLKHFKEREASTEKVKSKGSNVFAITGAVAGMGIGYFAGNGNVTWLIAGLIIGGVAGFIIGRNIDRNKI